MQHNIKRMTKIIAIAYALTTSGIIAEEYIPDLANGAQVWADTCMRCHNVRPPSDLSIRAWSFSMNHMRVRAGLTGKETRDIQAFILSSKTDTDRK
ncbi:MAG TPA: hypothetical protein ENK39_09310 [Epsilonproteobacteria bacterium]|nr:hypothetical protein [Campylobacterota bacterium]